MAISTGNQPDLETLGEIEGKPGCKGLGQLWACLSLLPLNARLVLFLQSGSWQLCCQKASEGSPWQQHWASPREFVCRSSCWKQSWDTCRLTTWEMVKINSTVPSSEGARGTMRKNNQQSLNWVKSITEGNVEEVSLELGIQKIKGCIWVRKGHWRS